MVSVSLAILLGFVAPQNAPSVSPAALDTCKYGRFVYLCPAPINNMKFNFTSSRLQFAFTTHTRFHQSLADSVVRQLSNFQRT